MIIIDKIKSSLGLKYWLIEIIIVSISLVFVFLVQNNSIKFNYYNNQLDDFYKKVLSELVKLDFDNIDYSEVISNDLDFVSDEIKGSLMILDESKHIVYNSLDMETFTNLSTAENFYINEKIVYIDRQQAVAPFYNDYFKYFESYDHLNVIYDFKEDRPSFVTSFEYVSRKKEYTVIAYTQDYFNVEITSFYETYIIKIFMIIALVVSAVAYFSSVYFVRHIRKVDNAMRKIRNKETIMRLDMHRTDEIGALNRSIKNLNVQLEEADGIHKEVFSNLSHELKSPIVLIAGYSEMVRDITWRDDKKREEHLNLIIKESNRMTNMVNEILDYSQIANGYVKLSLEYVSLEKLIQSEVDSAYATAHNYNLEVKFVKDYEKDVQVLVDSLRMSQVMRNLLNNAINHCDVDGSVIVQITEMDIGIKVSVNNKGEKIPDIDRALIFNRFYRAQHQNSRREGSGIGLSIVRSIYEAHGFEYGIERIKGYNSFYFIILPDRIKRNTKELDQSKSTFIL
ncbi:MAG: sensor histidine kinase [Lachnospirales bacterium]